MILANGCSHTHGTDHAIQFKYTDKLWPNIAGKMLGIDDVVNLGKGGDSAKSICDSTIHWLETNSIKPEYVLIEWTYANRTSIRSYKPYTDTPWAAKKSWPASIRESLRHMTFTNWYLEPAEDGNSMEQATRRVQHLGLEFPSWMWELSNTQDLHPYYIKTNENKEVQKLIDDLQRWIVYREALSDLPTAPDMIFHEWAMSQNHVANYCKAHDIPYYWWTVDSWYQPEFKDVFYLKPKHGEMFGNLGFIQVWLGRQGIIGNGDMYVKFEDRINNELENPDIGKNTYTVVNHMSIQPITNAYKHDNAHWKGVPDEHYGEDGHKYIGEMIGKRILTGEEPDSNAQDRELLKKNLLARPNLQLTVKWEELNDFAETGKPHSYDPNPTYRPDMPNFFYD